MKTRVDTSMREQHSPGFRGVQDCINSELINMPLMGDAEALLERMLHGVLVRAL